MFNIEQFHCDLYEGLNELVKIQIEMNTCSAKCNAADTWNYCDDASLKCVLLFFAGLIIFDDPKVIYGVT